MSQSNESQRSPIAVIGASALFPGSLDATGFWNDILDGSDLITDVPPTRWLIEDYYDPDPSVPDKTYAKRGAFFFRVLGCITRGNCAAGENFWNHFWCE